MSYNNLLSRNLISGILESREIYACIDAVENLIDTFNYCSEEEKDEIMEEFTDRLINRCSCFWDNNQRAIVIDENDSIPGILMMFLDLFKNDEISWDDFIDLPESLRFFFKATCNQSLPKSKLEDLIKFMQHEFSFFEVFNIERYIFLQVKNQKEGDLSYLGSNYVHIVGATDIDAHPDSEEEQLFIMFFVEDLIRELCGRSETVEIPNIIDIEASRLGVNIGGSDEEKYYGYIEQISMAIMSLYYYKNNLAGEYDYFTSQNVNFFKILLSFYDGMNLFGATKSQECEE